MEWGEGAVARAYVRSAFAGKQDAQKANRSRLEM